MLATLARAGALALVIIAPTADIAAARSVYDGAWSLSIVTTRGECSTYNFPVQISNGNVSFPGLNKARGRVTSKGGVRVSISAGGKYAAGSGRLTVGSGSGRWTGRSGEDRCSGTWSALRT